MENELSIWSDEFGGAVTICDLEGIVIYMNQKAIQDFKKYGNLIGRNLLDCHPEPSKSKVAEMLKTPTTNTYTIEKGGIKKIIHQSPYYKNGFFSGLVEISFVIPGKMSHHVRD